MKIDVYFFFVHWDIRQCHKLPIFRTRKVIVNEEGLEDSASNLVIQR